MGRKESNQTSKHFYKEDSVDTDQTATEEAVWSVSALFVLAFFAAN